MEKQQHNILTLYIGLFISTVLNFAPSYDLQIFAFLFFFVLFVACYIYCYKYKNNEFQYSHSKYLIKTIWAFSLFLIIGMFSATIFADNALIDSTMDKAMNGILMSKSELEQTLMTYTKQNFLIFLATIGPSFLYFFYRLIKGGVQAKNNEPMTNLKNWF